MVTFAQFGAGRIGAMHARNIAANPKARLARVVDINPQAARLVAAETGAVVSDLDAALGDAAVDAVLICSATPTHVDLMLAAAAAGKAILCEKPIDLDIGRARHCVAALLDYERPVMIGFNRRFDPHIGGVKKAIDDGAIGAVEQVIITSRDPGLAPLEYLKTSGGIFRDMTIHDFDLARWFLGEEPEAVSAMGACVVDPRVGQLGDYDSVMVTMRTGSGKLCHINCSRRATYGYDQRIEAHGAEGMALNGNVTNDLAVTWGAEGSRGKPLQYFFIERYQAAYANEINHFIDAVESGAKPLVGAEDGMRALALADAAVESARQGGAPIAVRP